MKDTHKEVVSKIGRSSDIDIFICVNWELRHFLLNFILSAIKSRSCAGNVEEGNGSRPCREQKNKTTLKKNGRGTYRNVKR